MKIISCKWLMLIGMALFAKLPAQEQCDNFPTYFEYSSSAMDQLSQKNSAERMSKDELAKWDAITADLVHNNNANGTRLYAYLYTAQKDAAFLSYNSHGEFMGSLGPISAKVLKLFFPSAPTSDADEYSAYLADTVFEKIKRRFDDENGQLREFPIDGNDPRLKDLPKPRVGLKAASCKPWLLEDPTEFMAAKPPSQDDPFWKQQSEIVKEASDNATKEQLQAIQFWAGKTGPGSGDWMVIADDYMFCHAVPFSKIICVRSILAEAGVDVDIALFYSKYTYTITRPPVVNPAIHPHIAFPKHPSYPSGHSTWSSACATILSYYFPEETENWFALAEEAGQSRIWAGIHYPIDHQGGWAFGTQLGEAILESPHLCF